MESPLSRALLLLFFLGCTAGESRSDTRCLDPYGMPLLDDSKQCPERSDASRESSLYRAEISTPDPGTASADDPAAKDNSHPWALLSDLSAGEISQSPTKGSKASITKYGLIVIIIGAMGLCISIAFVIFLFREGTEMIMLDNEQPEMVFELPAPAPVDPPMPGPPPATSGNPDLASQGPEESQRSSELPMAGADSPGGSGSPMDEATISPAVLEGNLEVPSEEEETVL